MKTHILSFILVSGAVLFVSPLFGQVDREELDSIDYAGVEFQNYEGPHDRIDSLEAIRQVGVGLSGATGGEGRYFNKYRILHLVDPDGGDLLNADILYLLPNAEVDHIDNLRWIIAGYLEATYGYTREESLLLARFATFYNAVFRGRLDYFLDGYTPLIRGELSEAKVGLSTLYSEWPGNSEIVIPLTGGSGGVVPSSDALTDEEVVESLRELPGLGLDDRKEISEFKEQEIRREERIIDRERAELEERSQELESAREELQERDEAIATAQESGEITPEEAEAERARLAAEEADIAESEEQIAEEEAELSLREKEQQDRLEQLKQERAQIAEDEKTRNETEASATEITIGVPFITYTEQGGERLGRMVFVEKNSGQVISRSPLGSIRAISLEMIDDNYLVIAGDNEGNRIISLISLDGDSLLPVARGTTEVSGNSGIFIQDDLIYTVIKSGERWIPGVFDRSLQLQGTLDREVAEYSFFSLTEDRIIFQEPDGGIGSESISEFQPVE